LANWLIGRLGVVGAAITWLPAIGISQLLSVFYLRRLLSRPFAGLLRPLLFTSFVSLLGGLLASWITSIIPGLFGFLAGGAMGTTVIVLTLWLGDRYWQLGLIQNLSRLLPQLPTWFKWA
jgi:hypothetical protein